MSTNGQTERANDVCALPLVHRIAAMLDLDAARWRNGDALPRGWHVFLFAASTPQSQLRHDGVAGMGITLPDVGLPRVVLGGKRIHFNGDVPIGASVRRASRLESLTPKSAQSGRIVIATVKHDICVEGESEPAIVEHLDYIFREAAEAAPVAQSLAPKRLSPSNEPRADIVREVTPDETLLFRYSSITSNPHRIHYDHPYATQVEGYRGLVVNGGLPALLLTELFRAESRREPTRVITRNIDLLFCNEPMRLNAIKSTDWWTLWAEDSNGRRAVEAKIE
jgi:3-methylfumaryl-CoA hydratase